MSGPERRASLAWLLLACCLWGACKEKPPPGEPGPPSAARPAPVVPSPPAPAVHVPQADDAVWSGEWEAATDQGKLRLELTVGRACVISFFSVAGGFADRPCRGWKVTGDGVELTWGGDAASVRLAYGEAFGTPTLAVPTREAAAFSGGALPGPVELRRQEWPPERIEIQDVEASSTRSPPTRYAAQRIIVTSREALTRAKAFDASWVEGVDGPGVGEHLTVRLATASPVPWIGVRNGFHDPKLFKQNGRVAELVVRSDLPGVEAQRLTLQDSPDAQVFERPPSFRARVLTLELARAYPGERWQDTALTALALPAAPYAPDLPPVEFAAAADEGPPPDVPLQPGTVWCHEGEGWFLYLEKGARCRMTSTVRDNGSGEKSIEQASCWWQARKGGDVTIALADGEELPEGGRWQFTWKREKARVSLLRGADVAMQDCPWADAGQPGASVTE